MIGRSVLLDTNIIIVHFKDELRYSSDLVAFDYCVARVTVGELYAGAFRSARPDHHRRKIDQFLKHGRVFEMDAETSLEYGKIWADLAGKGKPIPTNDIWIAALSIQHGLKLITNDKHFAHIEGLDHESW